MSKGFRDFRLLLALAQKILTQLLKIKVIDGNGEFITQKIKMKIFNSNNFKRN